MVHTQKQGGILPLFPPLPFLFTILQQQQQPPILSNLDILSFKLNSFLTQRQNSLVIHYFQSVPSYRQQQQIIKKNLDFT